MSPYDISTMKASLHDAQVEALRSIRSQFLQFMQGMSDGEMTIANLSRNRLVDSRNIKTYEDLTSVYRSHGLYIICTTYPKINGVRVH